MSSGMKRKPNNTGAIVTPFCAFVVRDVSCRHFSPPRLASDVILASQERRYEKDHQEGKP
eukprot:766400-Hanusia_phi.AAC.4